MTIDLVLWIIAAVLFALAFFGVGARFNLIAGGLFCWVMTNII